MEEHVWPDPVVYEYLNEEYVLISLYVDEKVELPEADQKEVLAFNGTKRKIRTVGQKWAHFQTSVFHINSQPFYVLMSPDGQVLNHPVTYTPDAEEYAAFLECGLEAFENLR
jgi:thiol:disulfide interchange protein DsbD